MEQYEPGSSELEVLTTAGDRAEDLEFGKGRRWAKGRGRRRWAKGGDNCSWANGIDRQRWFLGRLNALSNDLLHDLVESVLTCCSAAHLNWFRSQVVFVCWCRHLLDCGLGGEEILLRPLDALFFCHF